MLSITRTNFIKEIFGLSDAQIITSVVMADAALY